MQDSTTDFIGDTNSGATFDDDLKYRYALWRRWDDCELSEMVVFIGLNPSTADETVDDPTIRRCIGFAKSWGFRGLVMLNLFAYRATDPKAMKAVLCPTGPLNDYSIQRVCKVARQTICCWGTHGAHMYRGSRVKFLLREEKVPMFHLGMNAGGSPKHPLYLAATSERVRWT